MNPQELEFSAGCWTDKAFEALAAGEDSFAVHHAGVAAEHMLKAYLATLHPTLIVEGRNFDSLLHATGHGDLARVAMTSTRTIGLDEALKRISIVLPGKINIDQSTLVQVMEARNGVAHAGIHDNANTRDVMAACVTILDVLLAELGSDVDDFWGEHAPARARILGQHDAALRAGLDIKLDLARARFTVLTSRTPADELQTVILQRQQSAAARSLHYESPVPCPACGNLGWLLIPSKQIFIEITSSVFERLGTDDPITTITGNPYYFLCGVCDLELNTEELALVGLGQPINVDPGPPPTEGADEPEE